MPVKMICDKAAVQNSGFLIGKILTLVIFYVNKKKKFFNIYIT